MKYLSLELVEDGKLIVEMQPEADPKVNFIELTAEDYSCQSSVVLSLRETELRLLHAILGECIAWMGRRGNSDA